MPDRITIASYVVAVALIVFVLAYGANAVGQLRATGQYILPPDLIHLLQLVFGASVACLSFGGLRETRKSIERKLPDVIDTKGVTSSGTTD